MAAATTLPSLGPAISAATTSTTIAAASTAISTIPDGANSAKITVHDARLRYTYDGTTPSATLGHVGVVDGIIILESAEEVTKFRAFREGATSAVITTTFHFFKVNDSGT